MKQYLAFVGVCVFVLTGGVATTADAAGYVCSTKRYTACASGYFLNSNKCVKCPDNSTTSANNTSTTCTCLDGFSMNGKSTGVKTTSTNACVAYDAAAEARAEEEAKRKAAEEEKAKEVPDTKEPDRPVVTTQPEPPVEAPKTEPIVESEPETVPVTVPDLPKIEISKSEMTAIGFSGKPCWYMSSPRAYKECVHSVVADRLP